MKFSSFILIVITVFFRSLNIDVINQKNSQYETEQLNYLIEQHKSLLTSYSPEKNQLINPFIPPMNEFENNENLPNNKNEVIAFADGKIKIINNQIILNQRSIFLELLWGDFWHKSLQS